MKSNDKALNQGGGATCRVAATVLVSALLLPLLAGCGARGKEPAASQTAAKVNKEEITVHQINFVLAQQRALPAQKAASAGEQVLERLIDQELALQKATDQKIDRDPRVVQQLEATRRDIISRAYFEKIGLGAPKPTPAEIKSYYDAHPALFSDRRIYSFREIAIEVAADKVDALKARLEAAKDLPEFVAYLKSSALKYSANEAVRGAEQLPLSSLTAVSTMKDGQTLFSTTPAGANVLYLVASQRQPVDEQHAAPAIEQFLLNERRRKLMEDDLKALRGSSKIEYVGSYAADRARTVAATPPAAADPPPLMSVAPPLPPAASAAPQVEVPPTPVTAAAMPSNSTLDKGLKGMK